MVVKEKKSRLRVAAMYADLHGQARSGLSVTGLVRKNDDEANVICLALPPYADRWVDIPESSVAAFDHVGSIELNDVSHPLVRLHLKRPASPEAAVFHDLLAAHQASASAELQHKLADAGATGAAAAGYCYYDASGRWICT